MTPLGPSPIQIKEMELVSDGNPLVAHLVLPGQAAAGRMVHGLVLCHGFPVARTTEAGEQSHLDLAERLAGEAGWAILSFGFRGVGKSAGNFSLGGWLNDLKVAIDALVAVPQVDGVWVCGFAAGGALALCAAGEDARVRGVASFAAPADFADRAGDARGFVAQARAVGVIRDPAFPADLGAWARELREIRPLGLVGKIPPRPILLVHGSNDEVVPLLDARALADAAEGEVELRTLTGGGHRLRHDPRAIALLLGWLDRQHL